MTGNKQLGRKLTFNYALIQCIYSMGFCCVMTFASVFLLARGFTNTEVGIILTVGSGLAIINQMTLATFADKTKKFALRTIVSIILFAMTIISLILWLMPAILLPTAVLYLLLICLLSMQNSLIVSLAIEHINIGVPLNFGLARGIGSFAFALLALTMGVLVDDFGTDIIIPSIMVICLIGTVLVATFKKPGKAAKPADTVAEKEASGFFEFIKNNKRFMLVTVSIALMFFSHILINSYTIQIVKNVGGNNSDMGIASSIGGFLELPAMALFPFILKRIKSASLILKFSGVFFIVKAVITLLAPNVFWIYVAQCFQFFAYAMYLPASVYYTNRIINGADKIKGQASMTIAIAVCNVLSSLLGGFMLDSQGGVHFTLLVGTIVTIVGAVMLIFIAPRDKAEADE